jgi:hypothetical protein
MESTATILWALVFGSVGLGYFIYGRKQANVVVRYTGIALMVFPYFVSNVYALVAIGVVLLVLPHFIKI